MSLLALVQGYDYQTVFNGFTATLAKAEEVVHAETIATSGFLGWTGDNGVWAQQFGVGHAGEGIIVGVIDSGCTPENPPFAQLSKPRPDAATIAAKWQGTCDAGGAHRRVQGPVGEPGDGRRVPQKRQPFAGRASV